MELSDDEFVAQVESCSFPNHLAHHKEHIRLAYLYLKRYGSAQARPRVRETIMKYAASQGAAHKYHVTITVAWMLLVEHAALSVPPGATWQDLLQASPQLAGNSILDRYYSKELLATVAARQSFLEPDLSPLPLHARLRTVAR